MFPVKMPAGVGVVLPTAETVLDMGRTLIHKKLDIEMSLSGMTTNEIAARVFHSAIMSALGHSRKLIEEHMAIADKHFPT